MSGLGISLQATLTKLASETVLKLQTLSRMRFEFVSQIGGLKNKKSSAF